jgi:hypothetical protein
MPRDISNGGIVGLTNDLHYTLGAGSIRTNQERRYRNRPSDSAAVWSWEYVARGAPPQPSPAERQHIVIISRHNLTLFLACRILAITMFQHKPLNYTQASIRLVTIAPT